MDSIHKLTELFKEFPGIGPRQAKRFVYFLLTRTNGYTGELTKIISELKQSISTCTECFRFYPKDHSNLCPTCRDSHRTRETLMVVSRDVDFENIEKARAFDGVYFILGGTIPVLEKNPEQKIRVRELRNRIETLKGSGLKEIIIASDYNPEGEHTREYIEHMLVEIIKDTDIKISHLGRGLSTGSEIEYTDGETIKNALKNRI